MLTGKYRRGSPAPEGSRLSSRRFGTFMTDQVFERVEAIEQWGIAHGRPLAEVALSWLASQPEVSSVIAGATSAQQVVSNAAATHTDLSPSELEELSSLSR